MKYPVAERFVAPQGEGLYSGTVMAFIRFVGCSVGKGICHACDTEFETIRPDLGGGMYEVEDLKEWVSDTGVEHVCFTGGEPLDRDLRPLILRLTDGPVLCHVETSGTRHPDWLDPTVQPRTRGKHAVGLDAGPGQYSWRWLPLWVTVSPKPGYRAEMVEHVADELKVILGGLGDGKGWPSVADAERWADHTLTYVQPRNSRLDVDPDAMRDAVSVVAAHPRLRLSTQLHKYIRTR